MYVRCASKAIWYKPHPCPCDRGTVLPKTLQCEGQAKAAVLVQLYSKAVSAVLPGVPYCQVYGTAVCTVLQGGSNPVKAVQPQHQCVVRLQSSLQSHCADDQRPTTNSPQTSSPPNKCATEQNSNKQVTPKQVTLRRAQAEAHGMH